MAALKDAPIAEVAPPAGSSASFTATPVSITIGSRRVALGDLSAAVATWIANHPKALNAEDLEQLCIDVRGGSFVVRRSFKSDRIAF